MLQSVFRLGGVVVAIAVLAPANQARAYRPFTGTDADVADTGEFELELGPLQYLQEGDGKYLLAPATVLNLGIMPRVELIANFVNVIPLHPDGGPGYAVEDTALAVKVLLRRGVVQEQSGPSLALEGGPLLPEIHGTDGFGAALNVIVSERWDWFVAHLNNEASLTRGDLDFAWSTILMGEGDFGGPVRPVAELLWEREFASGASTYSALAGAIWSATESLELDAAVVVGSVDAQAAFEVRVGLTWAVPLWHPAEHGEPG